MFSRPARAAWPRTRRQPPVGGGLRKVTRCLGVSPWTLHTWQPLRCMALTEPDPPCCRHGARHCAGAGASATGAAARRARRAIPGVDTRRTVRVLCGDRGAPAGAPAGALAGAAAGARSGGPAGARSSAGCRGRPAPQCRPGGAPAAARWQRWRARRGPVRVCWRAPCMRPLTPGRGSRAVRSAQIESSGHALMVCRVCMPPW